MRFRDRDHAARLLADRLASYDGQRPLVLGIPRGGVPMAGVIANALHGEMDVVLVRKLRAPFQPELAMGAIDETGEVFRYDVGIEVSDLNLAREIEQQRTVLRLRREAYTGSELPIPVTGRLVIIVDDGLATGSSMIAAIHAVRRQRPARLVVAIPVAPPDTLARVGAEADDVVCLHSSHDFYAVGQFYEDFTPVTDDMVVRAIDVARHSSAG